MRKGSTYKESLGEYGSGWGWDRSTVHVFDQESGPNEPILYYNPISMSAPSINAGTVIYGDGSSTKGGNSEFEIEITNGQTLASLSQMKNQISLKPHAFNAGNYYSFFAGTGGDQGNSSICPSGWALAGHDGARSFALLLDVYVSNIPTSKKDTFLVNLPLSYLRTGEYDEDGSLLYSGIYGFYLGRNAELRLRHDMAYNGILDTNSTGSFSLRCVRK